MTRLQLEQDRLYGPDASPADPQGPKGPQGPEGHVRAMVLELARPADWSLLGPVWQGVQVELGLPAPAIAVNGLDGHQLWFSLAEALPASQASAFLQALQAHYLPELPARRLALWPAPAHDPAAAPPWPPMVPAPLGAQGPWSAFVAPDLAAVFSDEPRLDMPPNPDGQAKLLAGLKPMARADFELALAQLLPRAAAPTAATTPAEPARPAPATDPKRFLLDTLADPGVPLALRIEAAKALLPYFEGRPVESGPR